MATHFELNGGTIIIAEGQAAAFDLARTDPASAIQNGDNYEYFAENGEQLA